MNRSGCLLATVLLWLDAAALPVLPVEPSETLPAAKLPGESAPVARRLAEVAKRVAQEQWTEVVDEYQHILEEAGDDLVPLDPQKPSQCIPARRLCHIRLAGLPAAARQLYRGRVDDQAKKWLDQGTANRDTALLRRLVEQTFCSRHTERALDLLGDLAFERGDFVLAEQWWRMIAPAASEAADDKSRGLRLLFPDPQGDVAVVRAKAILCRLYQGEREAALAELKAFRVRHGKAEGRLAGRDGNLADILQTAVSQADQLVPPPARADWPTFAGDASRQQLLSQAPRCRWLDAPWRVPLEGADAPRQHQKALTASMEAQACVFQPVIAGDKVVVADVRSVTVCDLFTGRRLGRCDLVDDLRNGGFIPTGKEAPPLGVRYTVTVAGPHIYARLGARPMIDPRALMIPKGEMAEVNDAQSDSFLVCLGLEPDAQGKLVCRWQVKAKAGDAKPAAVFEGAPVVRDSRVYIAVSRFTDPVATTAIDCYDAATGSRRWRQEVCEGREQRAGKARYQHQLLTLAGPNVVYCSHAGAVVALDAATGKRAWAVRYARRGLFLPDGTPSPRDLAPCLCAGGRLFVAPADADRIFCLEADTGRTLWESLTVEVLQLLGVAHGRLIFTTGALPRCIRALDATTGRALRDWMQPDDGSSELPTVGRGLLAGGYVYWPTQGGLRVLNQGDGQPADTLFVPHDNPVKGNLAAGRGCLVVATGRELLGYVPEGHLLEQRRKDAAAKPQSAALLYGLARAEADRGLEKEARQHLDEAWRLAGPEEPHLRDRALAELHQLLLAAADRALKEGDTGSAVDVLVTASDARFPADSRLRTLSRLADLREADKSPLPALQVWQSILKTGTLRLGRITDAAGLPQPAGRVAAARIDALLRKHDVGAYAGFETEAARLLDATKDVQRLAEEYPNAAATRLALIKLAEQHREARRHAAAADVIRRLLGCPMEPAEQAVALAHLARAYEDQQCWAIARATWRRLARAHGDRTVAALDAGRPVREVVARHLRGENYRPEGLRTIPDMALPLARAWHVALEPGEQPVRGDDASFTAIDPCLFTASNAQTLTCRDAGTGKACWSRDLGAPLRWAGRHADTVVAAGARTICCLRLSDGMVLWRFSAADEEGLADFRLAGSQLFFLQGERRFWALDVETGGVLWSHWAPAGRVRPPGPTGRFHRQYHTGADRVILQASAGRYWLLDSHTGRRLLDCDASPEAWQQPPLLLDERRVILVPDALHVALLDLSKNREAWRHPIERPPSLSGEPPQLLGSGDTLLMLVSRNYGYELERRDPDTGARQWPKSVLVSRDRLDLPRAALDENAVFLPFPHTLRALSLADGKSLWELPLSERPGRWRAVVTQRCLLAYPLEAETELELPTALRQALGLHPAALLPTQASMPLHAGLPMLVALHHQARAPSRFSMLLCDPKDGRLIQRFNCQGHGPHAVVTILPKGAAVTLKGDAWGLR
jgi:cellulose synthase operon protein C